MICNADTGEMLGEDAVGEIRVTGPSVARGYWNNPTATGDAFLLRKARAWLRTGDLGFLHQGEPIVTGRHKDLTIVRGHNSYPQDIERSVEEHSEVVRRGRTVAFGIEIGGKESIAVAAEVLETCPGFGAIRTALSLPVIVTLHRSRERRPHRGVTEPSLASATPAPTI